MWNPRGIPRLSTELPTGLGMNLCIVHSQPVVHRLHRQIHARGLNSADGRNRVWIPRGVPVSSSRNPPVMHRFLHICAQQGDHHGRTRGWIADEPGTDSRAPQRLAVHPRVTLSTSPCRHAVLAGDSPGLHRFHSAYYYFSSSPREISFKTGDVETWFGMDRDDGLCPQPSGSIARTRSGTSAPTELSPDAPETVAGVVVVIADVHEYGLVSVACATLRWGQIRETDPALPARSARMSRTQITTDPRLGEEAPGDGACKYEVSGRS